MTLTREEALKIAKPILFNTDMVRAIQDNRKTVTRRLIKPRFKENEREFFTATIAGTLFLCYSDEEDEEARRVKAPYQVGDILYVRETWSPVSVNPKRYLYKTHCPEADNLPVKWHPSIHMPKEAARIFLRVTDVRVERLQDITEEQAIHEGIEPHMLLSNRAGTITEYRIPGTCDECPTARGAFFHLWNSTVKKSDLEKYGWAADPWVGVSEFERIEVAGYSLKKSFLLHQSVMY